jgi:hypothetical protein
MVLAFFGSEICLKIRYYYPITSPKLPFQDKTSPKQLMNHQIFGFHQGAGCNATI